MNENETKILNADWIKSIRACDVPSGGVMLFGYDCGIGKDKSVKVGITKVGGHYYVKSVG